LLALKSASAGELGLDHRPQRQVDIVSCLRVALQAPPHLPEAPDKTGETGVLETSPAVEAGSKTHGLSSGKVGGRS
jgi:hypothetical protein